MNMLQAAQSLVTRARAGDQNAIGMMATIRQEARKGIFRAQVAYNMLKREVENHPVFGSEAPKPRGKPDSRILATIHYPDAFYPAVAKTYRTERGFDAIVVALANGPAMTAGRIDRLAQGLPGTRAGRAAIRAMHAARSIQGLRNQRIPIAAYSKRIAWELGE